jgi:hypothetical protein
VTINFRCADDRSSLSAGGVTIQKQLFSFEKLKKKNAYPHRLNVRKLIVVVVFNTALGEELPLYAQIKNLTIFNGTIKTISINAFPGLHYHSNIIQHS